MWVRIDPLCNALDVTENAIGFNLIHAKTRSYSDQIFIQVGVTYHTKMC